MQSLTFLGTGGSVQTRDRMCSGILFQDKLIDVGFGVLTNLLRLGTRLDSINEIYISHTHSDHIGDFTGLVWAMAQENRTKPVKIVCSPQTASVLQKVLELQSTPRDWLKFDLDFVRPEDVGVKYLTTLHEPENLAYRFDTQHGGLVCVGDSARFEKIAEFAKECELMIHESTFLDGQESVAAITKHSTARDAGNIAKLAGARRLVLTHFASTNKNSDLKYLAEASAVFGSQLQVAKDLLTIRV